MTGALGFRSAQSAERALNSPQASCHSKLRCIVAESLVGYRRVALLCCFEFSVGSMASEAKQEEWTGGEVLFAGGTDWSKVVATA